jgi:hypothetical protein
VAIHEAEGGDTPGRVVGIGASAGGVDALTRVVRALPPTLPAAICIVLHVPSSGRSLLASILSRQTSLSVVDADEDQRLRAGCVYIAPNDRHLIVSDGHLRLDRGPKENGVRRWTCCCARSRPPVARGRSPSCCRERSATATLEERAQFLRRVASRHGSGRPRLRNRFNTAAEDALERADLIRTALGTRGERPHALDPQAEAAE